MKSIEVDIDSLKANTLHLFFDDHDFNECLENKIYELESLEEYTELHRVIFIDDFSSINMEDLGRHWVADKSVLNKELLNYLKNECDCQGIDGDPYIISAVFPRFAIDFEMSVEQHMLNPNENEIFAKKEHAPVQVTSISRVNMEGDEIDYRYIDFSELKSIAQEFNHTYTTGDCHSFAIALNRITKFPMISIMRKLRLPEDQWFSDDEYDKYDYEHAHAAVLVGNNVYMDVNGINYFKPEDEKLYFMYFGEDAQKPYFHLYSNEEELASHYADYNEGIIQAAIEDIKNFGIIEILEKYNSLTKNNGNEIKKRVKFRP